LRSARHPLLVLQAITPDSADAEQEGDVEAEERPPTGEYSKDNPRFEIVPNDLALEPEQRVLVLTGPNTGGKTVALKTVGLFALMARCGLHLPCDETSRVGWFDHIEATIGDLQSIEAKLSTFAAHMKALLSTLARAKAGTLVLVDEIAADTDPTQGQAIAQAILERVAQQGALAVVTTHFERLKALPFQDQRFRNAGVGFDEKKLRPTYRVTLDVPQGSSAFDIAEGLGLEHDIVERARELSGAGAGSIDDLLKSVESRARSLEEAQAQAAAAKREADLARAETERVQKRLEREIEEVRVRARQELLDEIHAARERARTLIAELQRAAQSESAAEAMRAANQAADAIRKLEEEEAAKLEAARPEPPASAPQKLEGVQVGQWVHVPKLGRDGEVLSLEGRDAQVAVGSMRLRVPQKSLRPPAGPRPKKTTPTREAKRSVSKRVAAEPEKPIVEEIDVRGHSIDQSIDRLEAFLDYHYGRPTTQVRVIHGHGTGALREALREHLRRSGYVKSLRPGEKEEGGDGVTVVQLS
jgi:DNA mismatch repair protein MutS2